MLERKKSFRVNFRPSALILFALCCFFSSKISKSADLGGLVARESLAHALLYTGEKIGVATYSGKW